MALNQQAQLALDQAKKLADDAAAIKSKSAAEAKAVVATAQALATPPATPAAGAKSFDPSKPLPSPAQRPDQPFKPTFAPQSVKSDGNKKEDVTQKIMNTPDSESKTKYVYSVFHTVMSIIAIFLSYRCNGCFQWIPFLMALFFPYLYIIYIIIFKNQCLNTSFIEPICPPEVVYMPAPPQYPSYGYNMPSRYAPPPSAPMPSTI